MTLPELTFARAAGLVLAVPLLVILLVGVHLAWQHRPKRRKSARERFNEVNCR